MREVLTAMIKAHEIQGCIALENSFNKVGLDHVVLVKVASTAVVCQLLGLTREQTINALSLAWVDGQSLRTYRHAPNTGSRKSWAAGDATSRAVRLALMARAGEMGYPSALTAKTWGFYDVSFRGQEFKFQRPYGSYVMENVLFKISYPAEFHAQTAVEAAMKLHAQLAERGLNAVGDSQHHRAHPRGLPAHHRQEGAAGEPRRPRPLRAIHDRDSADLGRLTAADYEDAVADPVWGPRIDAVRDRIACVEEPAFTRDYHDPEKRSIANSLRVELDDGTVLEETVEYPIGHRRRRKEGMPLLVEKFKTNLRRRFPRSSNSDSRGLARPAAARRHAGKRVCGFVRGVTPPTETSEPPKDSGALLIAFVTDLRLPIRRRCAHSSIPAQPTYCIGGHITRLWRLLLCLRRSCPTWRNP